MRKVIAAALGLYLLFYLLPLAVLGEDELHQRVELQPLHAAGDQAQRLPGQACTDGAQTVRVQMEDGAVQELSMDEYLWSVVAAEMPASFEQEALNAQAVAARTYTVSRQQRVTAAHPDADVCTDVGCCQAYITREQAEENWGEKAQEYADKITTAVAETDGLVILYDGEPIQAVFFSSAAGETLAAAEVWGSEVPYLSGVESPEGDEVPNYHTEVTVTAEQFRQLILEQFPDADLSGTPEQWLGEVKRSSSGAVDTVTVGGVEIAGTQMRTLFGLRSTSFTLTAAEEELTFSVTGYGHGVGMSQYGANAMAKEGAGYEEILTWYYTGVTVEPCPYW